MTTYTRLGGEALYLEMVGSVIDTISINTVFSALQSISDTIAEQLISSNTSLEPGSLKYSSGLYQSAPTYSPGAVRLVVTDASVGSFSCVLEYYISASLADPAINAILLNLASEVIFAIASSGIRGLVARVTPRSLLEKKAIQAKEDAFNVYACAEKFATVFAENEDIESMRFRANGAGEVDIVMERSPRWSKKRR